MQVLIHSVPPITPGKLCYSRRQKMGLAAVGQHSMKQTSVLLPSHPSPPHNGIPDLGSCSLLPVLANSDQLLHFNCALASLSFSPFSLPCPLGTFETLYSQANFELKILLLSSGITDSHHTITTADISFPNCWGLSGCLSSSLLPFLPPFLFPSLSPPFV